VFRWLPDLEVDAQRLALEGASDRPGETLHWFVDDAPVGRTRPGEPLFWPLKRGSHQIVCSTARGLSDRVEIAVE
jgi:membrane carboxypeptidase/penicillin-binding protein PbpC